MLKTMRINKCPDVASCRGRGGFSLLEILVALAILTIIVLMISMAFQQSADIWNNTSKQVGLEMSARGVIGRIQAEMAQAVPSTNYITAGVTPPDDLKSQFSGNTAKFIILKDTGTGDRGAYFIEYTCGGRVQRKESPLTFNGGWSKGASVDSYLNEAGDMEYLHFSVPSGLEAKIAGWTLPGRVDIEAKINFSGEYSFFTGISYGRNKRQDTPGEIAKGKGSNIVVGGEWQ